MILRFFVVVAGFGTDALFSMRIQCYAVLLKWLTCVSFLLSHRVKKTKKNVTWWENWQRDVTTNLYLLNKNVTKFYLDILLLIYFIDLLY